MAIHITLPNVQRFDGTSHYWNWWSNFNTSTHVPPEISLDLHEVPYRYQFQTWGVESQKGVSTVRWAIANTGTLPIWLQKMNVYTLQDGVPEILHTIEDLYGTSLNDPVGHPFDPPFENVPHENSPEEDKQYVIMPGHKSVFEIEVSGNPIPGTPAAALQLDVLNFQNAWFYLPGDSFQ